MSLLRSNITAKVNFQGRSSPGLQLLKHRPCDDEDQVVRHGQGDDEQPAVVDDVTRVHVEVRPVSGNEETGSQTDK